MNLPDARPIIGVIGPGEQATQKDKDVAYHLGKLIAQEGWVTLSGGRNVGVMDAVSYGARSRNGFTIGILPQDHRKACSKHVSVPIVTGMGQARNTIIVLSANILVAIGMGPGTTSEIALSARFHKRLISIKPTREAESFFHTIHSDLHIAHNEEEAIKLIRDYFNN